MPAGDAKSSTATPGQSGQQRQSSMPTGDAKSSIAIAIKPLLCTPSMSALYFVSLSTERQTLTAFAFEGIEGHGQDESGLSMMTVGVDARPFNSDMPNQAKIRNYERSSPHRLTRHSQELLHIFGFTWATQWADSCGQARGEAEADLTFLSKAGKLIGTDNEDGTFIVSVYGAEALTNDHKIPLTTARLLLWAMLHGGVHSSVALGCGNQVSHALLAGDRSDSLMQVVTLAAPARLPGMLEIWLDSLRTVLVDDTPGRKYPTLAASIPTDFLSVDAMHLYLNPVTTWSDGTSSSLLAQFDPAQPDLTRLATFCKARLGWMRRKIRSYFTEHGE
ncbi:hypothetical protein BDR06DRAFT_977989 [Suillus hirtellus]|nr:hypothetical protein BDR06DRAFT_977989 [Suillus hirtellus]